MTNATVPMMKDHWHKIAAAVMFKLGQSTVTLTLEEVRAMEGMGLIVRSSGDDLEIILSTEEEIERLSGPQLVQKVR